MGRVNIVEPTLDVEEKGGDLEVQPLEKADFVGEGCGGVESGEAREGASLMRVEKVAGPCEEGEVGGGDPFHYFGDGFQKNNDPKGGQRIVGGFAGFIEDDPVGLFERGGVVAILK